MITQRHARVSKQSSLQGPFAFHNYVFYLSFLIYLPLTSPQVIDFGVSDGVIRVDCAEVVVGRIALNFIDPKTQQPRDKPRTRPEIILRHLTTKSGSVYRYVSRLRGKVWRIILICRAEIPINICMQPRSSQARRRQYIQHGTLRGRQLCSKGGRGLDRDQSKGE